MPQLPLNDHPIAFPRCPHLPECGCPMSYRNLNRYRRGERGGPFYLTAMHYSQQLWQQGLPARSLLALTRGLYTNLSGDEPELKICPLPYPALAWMCQQYVPGAHGLFWGNPRVSYQHQAGRMRGPRTQQRRARAWACWGIVRLYLPQLPGDPRHRIAEPDATEIYQALKTEGIPGEAAHWQQTYGTLSGASEKEGISS